jgi:hypothetical protein
MKPFLRLLGAALLCVLLLPSLAFAETPGDDAAKDFADSAAILHELGLFQGSADGYELDRAPTRIEAAVMLVRLLGKEDEALAAPAAHPFGDVPKWASPYIGYMYANNLTKGVSANSFGNGVCDAEMYAAFALRALDYDDATGDFQYSDALIAAKELDLIASDHAARLADDAFLRGDLAVLSLGTLFTKMKDSDRYLLDRLISEGAVAATAAKRYADIIRAENLEKQAFLREGENGYDIRYVETYSLAEAGYPPFTSKRTADAKGLLTDDTGWREVWNITSLKQDSEESYTVYTADGWNYYDFGDGVKIKSPAEPTEEETLSLSGRFNRYKSLTIGEKDGKTIIREELSDEIAKKRAKIAVAYLLDVDEDMFDELSDDDYGMAFHNCTDTYTLDAEGNLLQWTENIDFNFRFLLSLNDAPYRIVADTVSDYKNPGRPVEVVLPDLQDYREEF